MDGWMKRKAGIQIRRMYVEIHQRSVDKKDTYRIQYLKKRMPPIMLCANWVCAGIFVDHEWVSESTNLQHVEEVMGIELDY